MASPQAKRPRDRSPGRFWVSANQRSGRHTFRVLHVLFNLVEVQIFVDRCVVLVHDAHGFVVLGNCRDMAQLGRNGGQLGTGQKHVGVLAPAVGEVAGAGGHHRGAFAHLGLVAHAQRADAVCGPQRVMYSFVNRVCVLSFGRRTATLQKQSDQQKPFIA